MRREKREKLIVIAPSGKQYDVGFLSPCKDGMIIGTARIENESSSHLTVLTKDGKISSHITPQAGPAKRQRFPPMRIEELAARFQSLVEQKIVYELSEKEQSEQILYITQKMADWFNALMDAVYQREESKKEVTHIINIKRGLEAMPKLLEALRNPSDFIGFCKANELLTDKHKIAGVTSTKQLILPNENSMFGVDLNIFLGLNLAASPIPTQTNNLFTELYQTLGISQYLDQEVVKKKYLDKLMKEE